MADNINQPDPRQQDEFNRYADIGRRISAELASEARNLSQELRDQLGIRQRSNDFDKALVSLSRQITTSAAENRVELGRAGLIQKQLTSDAQTLSSAERERLISMQGLSGEQIALADKIASKQKERLETFSKIEELQQKFIDASEQEKTGIYSQIKGYQDRLAVQEESLYSALDSADAETERLALSNQLVNSATKNLGVSKAEAVIQEKISNAMGVTGAILEGAAGFMKKLGMNSTIFNNSVEKAKSAMKDYADEQIRANGSVSRLSVLMKGLGPLAEGFGKALFDPATIILKIIDGFFEVNKAAVEFTRLTGQSASALAGVNTEISTTVDLLKTAAELTRGTGLNAISIFSPDQIGQLSDAKELLGLSAEQASKLGLQMKLTGKSADQFNQGIYDSVNAFNASTDSAISQKQALDDVLSASDSITASVGGSTKALGAAAAAARRIGMELTKVDSIANGLMDFEQSIQNELEAQLLTGKNINLNKARELALNNDLEGVAKELAKNGASAAEFANMNRIQQQALAKSLGMSRDELAKMVLTEQAMANMTDEQKAAARGVSLEQSKQIDIQSRIQKSLAGLAQAFAPILEAIVPVVEMLASALRPIIAITGGIAKLIGGFLKLGPVAFALKVTVGAIAAYFAAMKIGGWIDTAVKKLGLFNGTLVTTKIQMAATTAAQKIQTVASSAWNVVKNASIALMNSSAVMWVREKAALLASTVATYANTAAQMVQKTAIGSWNIVKNASIALMNSSTVMWIKEKLATIGSTVAMYANSAATTAWNAAKSISNILMGTSAGMWIAEKARMIGDTVARWANVGATAAQTAARGTQAAINSTLAASQTAVATTAAAAGGGMAAAGAGLGAFGAAAAPAIPVILAIGAALLMASPAIYALGQMVTGLATVIGGVLIKALEMLPSIVNAVAQGFVTMLGAVTFDKIAALALLGPALISAAAGLAIMSASMFTAIPAIGMLGALALMSGPLSTLAISLTAIASSIVAITSALNNLETEKIEELKGLISSTALAAPAVAASNAISGMINTITGGSESKDSSNSELLEEIKLLRAAVEAGGDVYMDGNKVGMALSLGTTRQ